MTRGRSVARSALRLLPLAAAGLLWRYSYARADELRHTFTGSGLAVDAWRGRIVATAYRASAVPGDEAELYAAAADFAGPGGLRVGWQHLRQGNGDDGLAFGSDPTVVPEPVLARAAGFTTFGEGGLQSAEWARGVTIPCWAIALIASVPLLPRPTRRSARRPGLCPACGYDLRATPRPGAAGGALLDRCPECGLAATAVTPGAA